MGVLEVHYYLFFVSKYVYLYKVRWSNVSLSDVSVKPTEVIFTFFNQLVDTYYLGLYMYCVYNAFITNLNTPYYIYTVFKCIPLFLHFKTFTKYNITCLNGMPFELMLTIGFAKLFYEAIFFHQSSHRSCKFQDLIHIS